MRNVNRHHLRTAVADEANLNEEGEEETVFFVLAVYLLLVIAQWKQKLCHPLLCG